MKNKRMVTRRLAATCVALASALIPAGAQERRASSESRPIAFCALMVDGHPTQCSLERNAGDELGISIYDDVARQRYSLMPVGDVNPIYGAMDCVQLPGGDLLAAQAMSGSTATSLTLWRLRRQDGAGGEGRLRLITKTTLDQAIVAGDAGTTADGAVTARALEGTALRVTGDKVEVFVSAQLSNRSDARSDRAIVRLSLSEDLRSIRRADLICDGVDPRVARAGSGVFLAVRRPESACQDGAKSPLHLLHSEDGARWSECAFSSDALDVSRAYSIAHTGGRVWVAACEPDAQGHVGVWSTDVAGGAWSKDESSGPIEALAGTVQPGRVWLLVEDSMRAARPQLAYIAANGAFTRR